MTNWPVVGGALPMPTGFPEGDGYVSGREYELDECCLGEFRRWRVTGTVSLWEEVDPGPPAAYGFVPPAVAARWAFPDGSFTYLVGAAFVYASPGVGWDAGLFGFISYYDGFSPGPTTTATAFAGPVPPFQPLSVLPTRWEINLWWQVGGAYDTWVTVSVGSATVGYGAVGARFTGGESYLLGTSAPPLGEPDSVGTVWGGVLATPALESQVGTVTAWDLRCSDDQPVDVDESVPFGLL